MGLEGICGKVGKKVQLFLIFISWMPTGQLIMQIGNGCLVQTSSISIIVVTLLLHLARRRTHLVHIFVNGFQHLLNIQINIFTSHGLPPRRIKKRGDVKLERTILILSVTMPQYLSKIWEE